MQELSELTLPPSPAQNPHPTFSHNMAAVRSGSPGITTRCLSDICCSTTSSIRLRPAPANASRPPRDRSETCCRNAGFRTERTYNRLNPKRIYYLSMEFLIGRSLANNVTNLLLDPFVQRAAQQRISTGSACSRKSPMPGSAMADWAARCVLSRFDGDDAIAGDGLRAALRIRHVSSNRSRMAGSANIRTTGCAATTLGRLPAQTKRSKSSSAPRSRCTRGHSGDRPRPPLYLDRHPV